MCKTLKAKFILAMLFMSVLLIVGMGGVAVYEQTQITEQQSEKQLRVLSALMVNNLFAALLFEDSVAAQETLSTLKAQRDIVEAQLYGATGRLFASYSRDKKSGFPEQLPTNLYELKEEYVVNEGGTLVSYNPMYINGERVGLLHVKDNMTSMNKQKNEFYALVLLTSFFAFSISVVLALWLQVFFTKPLEKIANVIKDITQSANYSKRVNVDSRDEFATLAIHFNNMIGVVEEHKVKLDTINAELEQRVIERTEDLEKTLELANQANKVKSEFLAVMSHEIRTPLNGVLGFAELLQLNDLGDEANGQVEMLNSSAQSLLTLLNEVLDFSKLDVDKLELDEQRLELTHLVQSCVEVNKAKAIHKGLKLSFDDRGMTGHCYVGDQLRLQQILNNLISNAVKFTLSGSVSVSVEEKKQDSFTFLTFRVSDTGVGLEQGKLADIFTPFTQVDSSVTRKFGGTGLGLAICKQLVDLMNGKIGIDSEFGKGSTFWFTIPMTAVASEEPKDDLEESLLVETSIPSANILIAEDNPVNQLVVKGILSSLNQSCTIVNDGSEALDLAKKEKFDLIFMDYHMPVMDGVVATKAIRELGSESLNYDTPIVALTADIQTSVRHKFNMVGGNDIVLKPFNRKRMNSCLSKWLNERVIVGKKAGEEFKSGVTKSTLDQADEEDNEPILMATKLDEIASMDTGEENNLVISIINLYLQRTPELIDLMTQAIAEKNTDDLFQAAHSIKSSSANVGAIRLQSLARNIEENSRDSSLENATQYAKGVLEAYEKTVQALKLKLKELGLG